MCIKQNLSLKIKRMKFSGVVKYKQNLARKQDLVLMKKTCHLVDSDVSEDHRRKRKTGEIFGT